LHDGRDPGDTNATTSKTVADRFFPHQGFMTRGDVVRRVIGEVIGRGVQVKGNHAVEP
jgi:hypothetical protein